MEHDLVSVSPQQSELGRALLFLENPILCSRKNNICRQTPPFPLWLLQTEEWLMTTYQTALSQGMALSCECPHPYFCCS